MFFNTITDILILESFVEIISTALCFIDFKFSAVVQSIFYFFKTADKRGTSIGSAMARSKETTRTPSSLIGSNISKSYLFFFE